MRGLRAQALMLRRLAGLTSLPHGTSVHRLSGTVGCVRTMLAHRTCSAMSPLPLATLLASSLSAPAPSWSTLLVRYKSTKGTKKGKKKLTQEEEDEDDPEASDYEDELQDDPGLPKDYKDQERSVQSFRYDLIMKAGLDMARNKIEDAFYSSKLRLNGQKLIKKSKTVKVGDTLDLVLDDNKETDTVTLMRVVFKKVVAVTQDEEKYRVLLRRWKHLKLSRQDAYKQ
ncbi:hypothetical protein JZ751_018946 [Albula glossodonta]|uniref:Mitochondrial transcription rescue factor 1 C-terminal domain-containing protein n=1 Tax=Albula glossodonta TaxID=121402 RepID=A0A8T2N4J0_9TELE|nr:hypothetical protein JZ751_018946 [Albula glossodonta]